MGYDPSSAIWMLSRRTWVWTRWAMHTEGLKEQKGGWCSDSELLRCEVKMDYKSYVSLGKDFGLIITRHWYLVWYNVCIYEDYWMQTSPVVHWLRLHASNADKAGSMPGQGTKVPHVTRWSQNKIKLFKNNEKKKLKRNRKGEKRESEKKEGNLRGGWRGHFIVRQSIC